MQLIYWTPITPPSYNLKRGIQNSLEIAAQGFSEKEKMKSEGTIWVAVAKITITACKDPDRLQPGHLTEMDSFDYCILFSNLEASYSEAFFHMNSGMC